jgi:hypothetical protein
LEGALRLVLDQTLRDAGERLINRQSNLILKPGAENRAKEYGRSTAGAIDAIFERMVSKIEGGSLPMEPGGRGHMNTVSQLVSGLGARGKDIRINRPVHYMLRRRIAPTDVDIEIQKEIDSAIKVFISQVLFGERRVAEERFSEIEGLTSFRSAVSGSALKFIRHQLSRYPFQVSVELVVRPQKSSRDEIENARNALNAFLNQCRSALGKVAGGEGRRIVDLINMTPGASSRAPVG